MADSPENKKPTRSEREREILAFWNEGKIFEKTLKKTKGKKTFVFYDGPPFATGTPHYGHLLTSFMKDVIPRYRTMKGNFVRRVWGWDCHGLPLENVVEKELGLEHKKDIEKFGIEKFNETAKVSVLRYDADWKKMIPRIGRWVDMEHSYKTMDASYSESIWWAFKTLYDKKLIYKGFKSMHICPRCETTLSNNEVTEGYRDITDISVTVKFELVDEPGTYVLAWTTTPWTLPGNVALAINDDIVYVKIQNSKIKIQKDPEQIASQFHGAGNTKLKDNEYYILAKDRLSEVLNSEEYEIITELKGKDLVGKAYKPLFDYYSTRTIADRTRTNAELRRGSALSQRESASWENGWKIYPASFVTTESGTGVVHIAPAFGEDDLKLGEKYDLPFVQHVRMDGTFASEVKDFAGMPVKPKSDDEKTRLSADIAVIKYLQEHNTYFDKQKIPHSYPHCWRCETPLLNYAASSWFVKVTALKKKLLAENNKVNWIPETMKHGRFGKWLAGARDWAISRSRFWGAPLPVWECSSCKKIHVVGSIQELQDNMKTSGNRYIVMRHGEAESNVRNITSTDVRNHSHLTPRGIRQAITTGKKFKKQKIDVMYSSDFARTHETAELVAKEIGIAKESIRFDPRLREINTGAFNNKSNAEYHAFYASNEERFYKAPEGGENLSEVKRRVMDFLYEIEQKHQGVTILIVTHEYPSWMLAAGASGALARDAALMKPEGKHFLETAQYLTLPFVPLPHNSEYELDLHRPYIDKIKFPCSCLPERGSQSGGGEMARIPDVFDCWFESGSMPYAQFHYPFENKKEFEKNFPADFIGEGLDQTRGWFYNMLVLSTGLFGKTPFKNVIVNGLILAEDGQKMSKRLKNYPDPQDMVNKYGADALRYYMLSSPIMRGEDLKFSEKGVDEVQKKVIGRLGNVLSFYELYADLSVKATGTSKNILDRWILARLNETKAAIENSLDHYKLDNATRPIGEFVDDLSTWYVRRSRDRFKSDISSDRKAALGTMRFVLVEFSKIIAPTLPFIAEELYQKVREKKGKESVHLESWPEINKQLTTNNKRLIQEMGEVRKITSLGLEARARAGIKVRQPLAELRITNYELRNKKELLELIQDELNVKKIVFNKTITTQVELDTVITPELKKEGQFREFVRNIQDLRKKEGLSTKDRMILEVQTDNEGEDLINSFAHDIKRICLLKSIVFVQTVMGEEIKIDDVVFVIRLQK